MLKEQQNKYLNIRDIPAHSNNYGNRPAGMPITLIVLHYTATGSAEAAIRWFQNSQAKASAHYLIDRDGAVTRMVPENKKAWHAGKSEWKGRQNVNEFSIGIELVNWGNLVQRNNIFYTWLKDFTEPYSGTKPVFLENAWWESYPDTQVASLKLLFGEIKKRLPIEEIVGHKDISPGRKIDPGPAFPWKSVLTE